jgi:3-methyladenine DNA glycosylase/8-oxoguanine DNA glycosylase
MYPNGTPRFASGSPGRVAARQWRRVRTWAATTNAILALREHLINEQVSLVVMEATGASYFTHAPSRRTLSSVASSLNTVSARAMLTAMINGETNPLQLADLAKGRMRRKIPDLAQALTGTFDAYHAQLKSMLRRLELVEAALAELGAVIVEACRPWQHQIELLQTIPGVGEKVAQVIIAETGADMSRFPTAAHLAARTAWCRR